MRLIDADALIEELHHGIFDDCDCKKDYQYLGIDDYIQNQPTAYDVDNVLEQLKEASFVPGDRIGVSDIKIIMADKALNIVEGELEWE